MKKITLIIFLSVFSLVAQSQIHIDSIPEVTLKDFLQTKCSFDTTANAQILYDIGYGYFEEYDRMKFVLKRKKRIQVFNKSGYDKGNVYIKYNKGKYDIEEITDFKATIYNVEDGKIVKQTYNQDVLLNQKLSDWVSIKKYAFPKLKEGSIIEYSYKIVSPFVWSIDPWYFQTDIPIHHSSLSIQFPRKYQYVFLKSGSLKFDYEKVYDDYRCIKNGSLEPKSKVYEWGMSDVPAFKMESFMTTDDDYLIKLDFQLKSYINYNGEKRKLFDTWKSLNHRLLKEEEDFGDYINANKRSANKILKTLNLEGLTNHEKAIKIERYVKDNYIWDKVYGIFVSNSKKKFNKTKTSNVAGINLFLLALLKASDIEAYPVILSTRSHGLPYYSYPLVKQYDYVLVHLSDNEGEFLLDATDPLLPFGLIPKKCLNRVGVQINKLKKEEDPVLIPLDPSLINGTAMVSLLVLDTENKEMNVKLRASSNAYDARRLRKKLKNSGEETLSGLILGTEEIEVESIELTNPKDVEKKFIAKLSYSIPYSYFGDNILVNPFISDHYKIPPFRKEVRNYPIDFSYKNQDVFNSTLVIPEGYEIESLPTDTTFVSDDGSFTFIYHIEDMGINIQLHADVNRKEMYYKTTDYPELKSFYELISEKFTEKIVLKKKE